MIVKEYDKDFHKMQLDRGGEFLACEGGSRTTNLNPQQPLISMIFTNVDPKCAGRLDDKQGGDNIVTMERVREAIALVVAHIRTNGLSLETDRWGRARGESRGFRQQPRGTRPLSCVSLGASLTLFWMKIESAATTILKRH